MNQIIDISRTELATEEPVTVTEAREQAIIDHSDDDTLLGLLIKAARRHIEDYCHISIINKRIIVIADWHMEYPLPYGPVIGIESVSTPTGSCGSGPVQYETAETNWQIDQSTFNPRSCIRYKIQYTAGMETVPDDLKQAILAQVAYLYEHRGDESKGVCEIAMLFAQPFKVMAWV